MSNEIRGQARQLIIEIGPVEASLAVFTFRDFVPDDIQQFYNQEKITKAVVKAQAEDLLRSALHVRLFRWEIMFEWRPGELIVAIRLIKPTQAEANDNQAKEGITRDRAGDLFRQIYHADQFTLARDREEF